MIDAHVHVWRIGANGCRWPTPDLAAIHRDFDLSDYRAAIGDTPIDRVILVQSQEDAADTDWLLSLATTDPLVAGVIGWVPLDDVAAIERIAAHPKLIGLRPMVQDRAADWYDDTAIDAGLQAMTRHGLVLDALVRPAHLPALGRLAARHPTLGIVIDHAAKPVFADLDDWAAAIGKLAAHRTVACKLSGLMTEWRAGDAPDAIEQAIAVVHRAFGPDRLIWGSDWPVLTLAAPFADWLDRARAALPGPDHAAVFQDNACHCYGLTS
jgi:L-fuconolactonase